MTPGDFLPQVYGELRRLAAAKMAHEARDHTLDATALVHEAWLRLGGEAAFGSRTDFIRAAAEAMRRILVEHARARKADKRGGGIAHVPLPDVPAANGDRLEDLDEALNQMEAHDATAAELVKLRYFCGYSHNEAAEILSLTRRQADRLWALARVWLYQSMQDGEV